MAYTYFTFANKDVINILSPVNGVVTQVDTERNKIVLKGYVYADEIMITGINPTILTGRSLVIGTKIGESLGNDVPYTIYLPASLANSSVLAGMVEKKTT